MSQEEVTNVFAAVLWVIAAGVVLTLMWLEGGEQ